MTQNLTEVLPFSDKSIYETLTEVVPRDKDLKEDLKKNKKKKRLDD